MTIAGHPDDEVLGAGAWLARLGTEPAVTYLTDGVPKDRRWFAPGYRSPVAYRRARRREAQAAWRSLRPGARLFFAPFADQELAFRLRDAAAWLAKVVNTLRPALLLAPAFEGGHPDHDAANLLAAGVGTRFGLPVWEYALYTARRGRLKRQCFPGDRKWSHRLLPEEAVRKRGALGAFISQHAGLRALDAGREALRPLPAHDYRRPAMREPAVYERWGFRTRAEEVAASFGAYLEGA